MNVNHLLKAMQSYLESDKSSACSKLRDAERESLHQHVLEAQKQLVAGDESDSLVDRAPDKLFKRIMVAIDSSEQACFAAKVAARLAKDLRCELALVNVVHLPPLANPELACEQWEMRPVLMENGQSLLDRAARRLVGIGSVEKILREGDPATEIADTATRMGADLIVIGTHGRGRFASAVVGSVAQGVMRNAKCPVLCVTHDPCAAQHDSRILFPAHVDYFPLAGV